MKILVAYASKYGSTKGIAEHIGKKLNEHGLEADVINVDEVKNLESYNAFVIGSAVFMGSWMKQAKQFVSKNQALLSTRPVWLFSSGPTSDKKTDAKGRDLLETSVMPQEIDGLKALVKPRGHKVFFGALFGEKLTGFVGFVYRIVQKIPSARQNMPEGDFRDWKEIESWTNTIAEEIKSSK